ncbi:Dabb family protein [Jatrophihabitans sp. DSM 45814]
MMITHIVLLGLTESTEDVDRIRIVEAISNLRIRIPQIRALTVHTDLEWSPGNAGLAVIVILDNREDHALYEAHPAHKEVERIIEPFVTSRAAVQSDDTSTTARRTRCFRGLAS